MAPNPCHLLVLGVLAALAVHFYHVKRYEGEPAGHGGGDQPEGEGAALASRERVTVLERDPPLHISNQN
jgi:hypothetical protein